MKDSLAWRENMKREWFSPQERTRHGWKDREQKPPGASRRGDPKTTAFGLLDWPLIPHINRILRPYGIRLIWRSCSSEWGDQVEFSVLEEDAKPLLTEEEQAW